MNMKPWDCITSSITGITIYNITKITKKSRSTTKIKHIFKMILDRKRNTNAADLVVIVRSTATGARVGSTVDVCVKQGSRSMLPPPFCKHIFR